MFKFSTFLVVLTALSFFAAPATALPSLIKVYYDSSYNVVGESGNAFCPRWGRITALYTIEDCG